MKQTFINPEAMLNNIGLIKGMKIADFGCGAGAWTIPAAEIVRSSGKVYACDIFDHMLEVTGAKAKKHNLKNIKLVKTDLEIPVKIGIPKKTIDWVVISNVLFQAKSKEKIFNSVASVLKKDGQLLVIEWQPNILLGPDKELRCKKEDIKKIATNQGFLFDKEIDAGHFHYGLLFKF
jgi:ubiquinone/menaquinone biosynthesis C-methylase UbiE